MDGDAAGRISRMRRRVHDVVDELAERSVRERGAGDAVSNGRATRRGSGLRRFANELLHAPTASLRRGELSDEEVEDAVAGMEARGTRPLWQRRGHEPAEAQIVDGAIVVHTERGHCGHDEAMGRPKRRLWTWPSRSTRNGASVATTTPRACRWNAAIVAAIHRSRGRLNTQPLWLGVS